MNAERLSLERRAQIHAALGDAARVAIVDRLTLSDASPAELSRLLGQPSNLLAHHLGVLDAAGLIRRSRSENDRRRTYLQLAPGALGGLLPTPVRPARRVVFVCTHNSARSQLAAALLAHRSQIPSASAGTRPASRVHPRAVAVGRRHGLTLEPTRTSHVSDVISDGDLVVSVCDRAHEGLPADVPQHLHWSVSDPVPQNTDAAFEGAYLDLRDRIDRLVPALTPEEQT
jgi:ArsR family transcriptional regulator, arsenate/arsenite/antimonite-responsive transcriptional repressor / arsenate reductase (thioredoxin)